MFILLFILISEIPKYCTETKPTPTASPQPIFTKGRNLCKSSIKEAIHSTFPCLSFCYGPTTSHAVGGFGNNFIALYFFSAVLFFQFKTYATRKQIKYLYESSTLRKQQQQQNNPTHEKHLKQLCYMWI